MSTNSAPSERLFRVVTSTPAASETACVALARHGIHPCGGHACGFYLRTATHSLVASVLAAVVGVHGVYTAGGACRQVQPQRTEQAA